VTGNCLGYRMVDHQFLIDEDEEKIVLRIFSMYLSGMGKIAIAKNLNETSNFNRLGQKWTASGIRQVLTNEKYVGDLQLQKWYTVDHISKKVIRNHGEKKSFLVRDNHDAIIDRTTFETVRKEIIARSDKFRPKKKANRYPFTGHVKCGKCGGNYRRKTVIGERNYNRIVWICNNMNTLVDICKIVLENRSPKT